MPTTTTNPTTTLPAGLRPRVWLVAGLGPDRHDLPPTDRPTVRDDRCRCWTPGPDGRWHTTDNRHHATWAQLHQRTDLVEILPPDRELGDGNDDTTTTKKAGAA